MCCNTLDFCFHQLLTADKKRFLVNAQLCMGIKCVLKLDCKNIYFILHKVLILFWGYFLSNYNQLKGHYLLYVILTNKCHVIV